MATRQVAAVVPPPPSPRGGKSTVCVAYRLQYSASSLFFMPAVGTMRPSLLLLAAAALLAAAINVEVKSDSLPQAGN